MHTCICSVTDTTLYIYVLGAASVLFPDQLGWIIPDSIKTLSCDIRVVPLLLHFVVFDSSMWCIHYLQHRWRWLYYNTHAIHHTIRSPTMICALTGFLPDTCLLIIVPLHFTVSVIPNGNFATVFVFALISLFHLHCIHSEFEHCWDPLLRRVGIVNSWDHHVVRVYYMNNLFTSFSLLRFPYFVFLTSFSVTRVCVSQPLFSFSYSFLLYV